MQPIRGAGGDPARNKGHFASLDLILREGVDLNVARMGAATLHFIAARGGLDGATRARFAAMLIDHGARLDLRDELLKSTPLGWACRWGRLEMAEVLVARGALVQETDSEPWATPVAWAKRMDHSKIVSLLDGLKLSRTDLVCRLRKEDYQRYRKISGCNKPAFWRLERTRMRYASFNPSMGLDVLSAAIALYL
jgi:hypothetical protein